MSSSFILQTSLEVQQLKIHSDTQAQRKNAYVIEGEHTNAVTLLQAN